MSGVNKVILVGRLARDVELKYAANGNAIANVNLVTSEEWKDKSTGEKQEKPEFHRIVIFGKLAEIAGQYLTKGSQVYFEGQNKTRKYQDNNTGQDKFITEVVVDSFNGTMQMLGGGNNNGQQQGQPAPQNTGPNNQQNNQQNNQNTANNGGYGQGQKNNQDGNFQQPMQSNNFDSMDVPFKWESKWPELFMIA